MYGLLHISSGAGFFDQEFRIFVSSQRISLLKTVDMWFAVDCT